MRRLSADITRRVKENEAQPGYDAAKAAAEEREFHRHWADGSTPFKNGQITFRAGFSKVRQKPQAKREPVNTGGKEFDDICNELGISERDAARFAQLQRER